MADQTKKAGAKTLPANENKEALADQNDQLAGIPPESAAEPEGASTDSTDSAKTPPPANGESVNDVVEEKFNPNSELNLSVFDYRNNFQGENFRKYLEFISKLRHEDQYDFEMHVVKPIKEERFAGMPGSPVDVVGLQVVTAKPRRVSRMALKHAINFNGVLKLEGNGKFFTVEGAQWTDSTNSEQVYFLLKQ